ncbi:MAG: BrnT family toxin, partial [Phycisphaerales bacterium]|nr:BrnT family toxin [Phycisphaerales bacterium]
MDPGFVWDNDKYELVQEKHGVVFHEVVSAFDDPNGLEEPDPQGHRDRYMLLAKSHNERVLQILYTDDFT